MKGDVIWPQAEHLSREVLAEDEGTMILRNVGDFSLETASLPGTHGCSRTPLRRTKICEFEDDFMQRSSVGDTVIC